MTFATIVFLLALVGIVALFGLKHWELARGRVLAPALRESADKQALRVKELMGALQIDLAKLPPLLLYAAQRTLHAAAVDFGHLMHWLGVQAHNLADLVSHKRNFQRGETRSEFLKKVSEHKNGGSE
jgi:hypothetical protein